MKRMEATLWYFPMYDSRLQPIERKKEGRNASIMLAVCGETI
jgi:hypothetical protein